MILIPLPENEIDCNEERVRNSQAAAFIQVTIRSYPKSAQAPVELKNCLKEFSGTCKVLHDANIIIEL